MPPWAHHTQHPKRHLDWFSHDGKKSLYFIRQFYPIPPAFGASVGVISSQLCRVPILYNGPPLLPSKLLLHMGDLDSNLMHGSLGPPESTAQTASGSVQRFLQGSRLWQPDRQTDHATASVTIGRIYVIIIIIIIRFVKRQNVKRLPWRYVA